MEPENLARHGRGAADAPDHAGGRKGDLSRFVEDAVNREVLRQTVQDVRVRNADLDEAEVLRLVEDELGALRSEAGSHVRP